jgi:hypothetical protein
MAASRVPIVRHPAHRFLRRKPFVPEMNGQAEPSFQLSSEFLRNRRLRAGVTAQRQRQPDNYRSDLFLPRQRRDGGDGITYVGTVDTVQRQGEMAVWVGYSHTYAPLADVEAEQAGMVRCTHKSN